MRSLFLILLSTTAWAGSLSPCPGTGIAGQEQNSNCVVANPGGSLVVTASTTDSPTFVDTPITQNVTAFQTTLTGLLNESFNVPFSDPAVQSAILGSGGIATLLSGSTTLESSIVTIVLTSPFLAGNFACAPGCEGVTVAVTASSLVTFGPAIIMIGPDHTDEFDVAAGTEDINVNTDFAYLLDRNVVTTNTYLTTQTYDVESAAQATVPEPGTWTVAIWLVLMAMKWRRLSAEPRVSQGDLAGCRLPRC